MGCLRVDVRDDNVLRDLEQAPTFRKHAVVVARPARAGESLDTVLASGQLETRNVARTGDWVVTNPSGESYLVPGERFARLYAPSEDGLCRAAGRCKALRNPFGVPIEIEAAWGPERGGADCWIAAPCDAEGHIEGTPYLVDGASFRETYRED